MRELGVRVYQRSNQLKGEHGEHDAGNAPASKVSEQNPHDQIADVERQGDQVQRLHPRPGRFRDLGHALCLVLCFVGCKHVSELQAASHTDAATAAEVATHEVRESGPEHIVMTVEEYEQLCPGKETAPEGAAPPLMRNEQLTPGTKTSAERTAASHGQPRAFSALPELQGADGLVTPYGRLLKRTVTVTDRGPSLDDLRQLSSLQSKVNTALAVHEKKKDGPVGLFAALLGLWPVVLIGGAILAGFVVWRAKPNWLSFLFKLLGRSQ